MSKLLLNQDDFSLENNIINIIKSDSGGGGYNH